MPCLDEQQLRAYASGSASESDRAHVTTCASCREALSRISQLSVTFDSQRTVRRDAPPEGVLAEGTSIQQYVVRRRLGAGAMGAVFAAWDVRLEREVALKVLHLDGDLLAEARLLAKLSHPNVVAVHEVLSWNGRAVLVMELVQGQTLRVWLKTSGASLRERLGVLQQCAEGLAAAHAAGIVHRDFKPDNVLVDSHNRPRLLDFGLALHGQAGGGLAGSPAYMALRQLEGAPADAASDQFSWWVTVAEALTGRVPHDAPTLPGLVEARRTAPELPGVPRWLRASLLRGLSNDASSRFPSMHDAARALTPPRRTVWLAAALVALAGVAAVAWPRHSPCDELPSPDALVARAKNPALAAVAREYGEAQLRCRALPAPERPDRAACLTTVAQELDLALAAIEGTDFAPDFAARVLKRVRPVARCEKTPLPPRTAPEPDRDAAIASLRSQLRFDQLRQQGDFAGAAALATAHVAEVRDGGSPSVRVWAGINEASALSSLGRAGETVEHLRKLEGVEGAGARELTWVALGRWLFECYASSRQHCEVAERQATRAVAQLDEPWANAFALEVQSVTGESPPTQQLIEAWRALPGAGFELERAVFNELVGATTSDDLSRKKSAVQLSQQVGVTNSRIDFARLNLEVERAAEDGDFARVAELLARLDAVPTDDGQAPFVRARARIYALSANGDARGALALLAQLPVRHARDRYRSLLVELNALLTLGDPRMKTVRDQLELVMNDLQDEDRFALDWSLRRYALVTHDVAMLEQLTPEGADLRDRWQLALLKNDAAAERSLYDEARRTPASPVAAWLLLEEALQAGHFDAVATEAARQRAACTSSNLQHALALTEGWALWELGKHEAACRSITAGTSRNTATPRQLERFHVLQQGCPFLGVTPWPKATP